MLCAAYLGTQQERPDGTRDDGSRADTDGRVEPAACRRRLQRLLGMRLNDCKALLEVDPLDCQPAILNAKIQVIRAVLHTTVNLGLESQRVAEERERVIGELAEAFRKG